ncbi:hypothetical protein BST44_05655 [Mycobacterium scrofulaceum]|uniref:Transmembrane protein n=1 Tax=Mycobacterium scrofulaceum TaxID=1783 RepID=A0A1X0KL40_MYCSC|nr:hypothetical protein BST44_05655 [Mycobacterium scrofulaceum]
METFTVPLPRTLFARLFGRNPLVRASDRLEAVLLVLAVAVSLLTVPIAAAVGTAVHESRSRAHVEWVQTRQPVSATVVGAGHPRTTLDGTTATAPARWEFAGAEHTGDVTAPLTAKVGDRVEIWVNHRGAPVSRPMVSPRDEAVGIAAAMWCAVSLSVAASFAGVRHALDGARGARWQHEFDRLVGHR